jgi:hypothetical protein
MYIIEYNTDVSKYIVSIVRYDENNKVNGVNSFYYTDSYMFAKLFKNKEECNAVVNFIQNYAINHQSDIDINSIKIKRV